MQNELDIIERQKKLEEKKLEDIRRKDDAEKKERRQQAMDAFKLKSKV